VTLAVGAASVDITPPSGTPMAGYGARTSVSGAVHDPLLATALVLSSGGQAALVSVDLAAVDSELVHMVRELVQRDAEVPGHAVLIAATHTHSGPLLGPSGSPQYDRSLKEVTARKIADAVKLARRRLRPGHVAFGRSQVHGVAANRRDAEVPVNTDIHAWRIDADRDVRAIFYTFACHPTVLSHENLEISADWPGAVRTVLSGVYGPIPVGFLNGAAGDVSTRYTRRSSTFDEMTRLGRLVAAGIVNACESASPQPNLDVRAAELTVDLSGRRLPTRASAERELGRQQDRLQRLRREGAPQGDVRSAEVDVQGAQATLRLIEGGGSGTVECRLQAIRFGDQVLIAVPGELFQGVGRRLASVSSRFAIQPIGYANGSIGYIPTEDAFDKGGYEIGVARVGRHSEYLLVEAANKLVRLVT